MAAKQAIRLACISESEIDGIFLATATPDALMPATVNVVADQLGLNRIASYQIQSGCAGAIQALDMAVSLIQSGRCHTILVMGGDVSHPFLDLKQNFHSLKAKELVNYLLFGDGAGAVILTSREGVGLRVDARINECLGLGRAPGQTIKWQGVHPVDSEKEPLIFEDYRAIERGVPLMTAALLQNLYEKTGWNQHDVDYFLPPQLSRVMTHRIIQDLGLPQEKAINCVEQTGNTGNALPFFQIEMLWSRLRNHQKALLFSIESSKWIQAGVGLYGFH